MKFVGTKLSKGLYEKLQEYKQRYAIETDSEAIRDILRKFLLGTNSEANNHEQTN